ncbi:uncharacterized protein LOC105697848 isoform X2 [Orussus abietinus]|uniref:uncharacterized protein LOC105697848 isoform X2 n=1 Tax=Orussus abietinus TaxID=222816 RepID=UPI000624FBBC|nr:uncharacterized protein LOC105697848 isoform X2 [Orussus abietinus]
MNQDHGKAVSQTAAMELMKATDDEIQSELEALRSLENNLYGDPKPDISEPFTAKKNRATISRESKFEKVLKSEKVGVKLEKQEAERIEKQEVQVPVLAATVEELQVTIRQAAITSEEKYKVLDARDRLLRLKQVKSHSLATAKATKGTCPDMCPEKERLMRESQRQVSPYEQMDGSEYKINHMNAVKQYSRSSADQEEPMAHELRPVVSLKMTMSYLLHEIADLCEQDGTNLAEWFHFLWDRTRGIRKDITQQELCCIDSVELVEQCARFHIICSERLCAEEPSVFDKKINTENLTKCLQTLKYMYHDLRVKGITCKNEPEFRGYVILLNLNDGNFMWDVQKLPVEIQKSKEIKFAIKVYLSLESNNYCRFFKLVRKTTYLNACILLRYFNQVRVNALSIMVKAYCRTASMAYPLYELIDILGFEDEEEAMYFCKQVGLRISKDEMHVMMNKQNFTLPESNIEQGRAGNVVESKRTMNELQIGRCIAGGIWPETSYKNHKPHNSFDANGFLLSESINAEDQNVNKQDEYEFMEDEPVKFLQRSRNQSTVKNQKELNDIGTRKLSDSKQKRQSSLLQKLPKRPKSKTRTESSPITNIFKDSYEEKYTAHVFSKPEEILPAETITRTDTKTHFVFKPPATVAYRDDSKTTIIKTGSSDVQAPFKEKIAPFEAKSKEAAASDVKSFRFLQTTTANKVVPVSCEVDSKSNSAENVFSTDVAPPFVMAVNKSIFSGAPKGNIFGNRAYNTNIFTTDSSSSPFATKPNSEGSNSKEALSTNSQDISQSVVPEKAGLKRFVENVNMKLEHHEKSLKAEKARIEQLERERKLQRIEEMAKEIFDDLQAEITKDICALLVEEQLEKLELFNRLSRNITEELLDKLIQETCEQALSDEIYRQKKLSEISIKIRTRLVKKYYNIWKQYAFKKRRERDALEYTPVWLQRMSVKDYASSLYRSGQELVIASMRHKRAKLELAESDLPFNEGYAPIEMIIHAGIRENVKSSEVETVPITFWKMVISWPDLENKVLLWRCKRIANEYLNPSDYTVEPIVKTYKPNSFEVLNICIRYFEGIINERNLIGTDSLLFIAAAFEELNCVVKRLTKTILSRCKLMPIPLAIIIIGEEDLNPEKITTALDLEKLSESGYISEYKILVEKSVDEKVIVKLIQSATLWLAMNKPPMLPLEMDFLKEILNTCLTEELWLRLQSHSLFSEHLETALNDPDFVIKFHNEAIAHLMDIILDQETLMYTDFPPEFKHLLNSDFEYPCTYEYFDKNWKDERCRAWLENILNSLILVPWSSLFPDLSGQ